MLFELELCPKISLTIHDFMLYKLITSDSYLQEVSNGIIFVAHNPYFIGPIVGSSLNFEKRVHLFSENRGVRSIVTINVHAANLFHSY